MPATSTIYRVEIFNPRRDRWDSVCFCAAFETARGNQAQWERFGKRVRILPMQIRASM